MNNYHKQSTFSQVRTSGNAETRIAALEKQLSDTHEKLNTELRNIERGSSGSQLLLVVSGAGASGSSAVLAIGGYAAKEVVLAAGTHTVSFGKTFTIPFIPLAWATGTVEGNPTNIGCRILSNTDSDMVVSVDADCTLRHFEIPTT